MMQPQPQPNVNFKQEFENSLSRLQGLLQDRTNANSQYTNQISEYITTINTHCYRIC